MGSGVRIPPPAPRRLSSVVEHFHGKEGVSSSNLEGGSRISYSFKSSVIKRGFLLIDRRITPLRRTARSNQLNINLARLSDSRAIAALRHFTGNAAQLVGALVLANPPQSIGQNTQRLWIAFQINCRF